MNIELKVQVCDATMFNAYSTAGNTKISFKPARYNDALKVR